MLDVLSALHALRRPRLLLRAARIGQGDYRRTVHLQRHLGIGPLPCSGAALMQLMEIEAEMNAQRKRRAAEYSAARHVDILIAMMGEARILRATHPERNDA